MYLRQKSKLYMSSLNATHAFNSFEMGEGNEKNCKFYAYLLNICMAFLPRVIT